MTSVASQLIEEVTAHVQSDSLEDAREICADSTYFLNNVHILNIVVTWYSKYSMWETRWHPALTFSLSDSTVIV